MKIALIVLGLFVVSALAGDVQLRSLRFKQDQIYEYTYSGHVLTGIPTGSSLYSGHQLNSTIELVGIKSQREGDNGRTIIKMRLTKIVLGHLLEEVSEVERAVFEETSVEESVKQILGLPVQFAFNEATDSFEWVEVQKSDAPWSVNIKKSIIDLLQVNLMGKQAQRSGNQVDESELLEEVKLSSALTAFGVHEPTIQGECETNYQVIQTHDPNELKTSLRGAEKFFYTVTKTRNFANCVYKTSFYAHNWDRKGCVEYCKRYAASTHLKMEGLNKHLPIPDETETACSCDPKEARPVDQYSTVQYNISFNTDHPIISKALGKGKIIVDNHGTKVVVYTRNYLEFKREQIQQNEPLIPTEQVIRVDDLIFTLFPYKGMNAGPAHVTPIYNLLVPKNSANLVTPTVDLLNKVVRIVREEPSEKDQSKAVYFMTQVVRNLAHLDADDLKRIFDAEATIEENEQFTNSEHAVFRQLFLDALAHVGTKATGEWFAVALDSQLLAKYEARQFVEVLPRNVYAPTRTLLLTLKKEIDEAIKTESWNELSAFAISYGKLISKACRFEHRYSEESENSVENPWYKAVKRTVRERKQLSESNIDWPEFEERCTRDHLNEYITSLNNALTSVKDLKGKIILAQALAHSGQYEALKTLTPYITGSLELNQCVPYVNASSTSDCHFLRTSIIYSLHHMIPVSPKLLRSLVLPVFQNKLEPYELRLAAFTVFMAAGPKRHELESIVALLRGENNRQVITMVRSVLEETANLTQACHLPLARAAQEIIPTLPVYDFDGVYSKASYNEWYSQEKSTGFFLNGQYVANNMSLIPRHGYLTFGSHWKSLSNSWFTVAYQQKGLQSLMADKFEKIFSPEWFLNSLSKTHGKPKSENKPIDEIFKSLGITERTEEDFKLKLFIKLYEQTSLFTLDKYTIEAAYEHFTRFMTNFVAKANGKTDFNWVRFYMPSSYSDVITSDIGLPVAVIKQRPHIISLRTKDVVIKTSRPLRDVSFTATLVPQMYYASVMSVSAYQQGLAENFGVYSIKKTLVYAPVKVAFAFELLTQTISYSVEPILNTKIFHTSNSNLAFRAINYIGLAGYDSPIKQKVEIRTRVPSYEVTPRFPSKELGIDVDVDFKTERPWYLDIETIPVKGLANWIIEKYAEQNEFKFDLTLTLRPNKVNPSTGFAGTFNYASVLTGDFKEATLMHKRGRQWTRPEVSDSDWTSGRQGERALRTKTELANLVQTVAEQMVLNYPDIFINKKAPTFARAVSWSFETLSGEKSSIYNATLYFIQALDYQTYWVKFVSELAKPENTWFDVPRALVIDAQLARPALPSTLKWEVPQLNKFIAKYIANVSWGSDFETDMNSKIYASGTLMRTDTDEVVGDEMKVQHWYKQQCNEDIKNKIHMSYACQVVASQEAYFNKITGTIEFNNLEKRFVNATQKLYTAGKLALASYWRPWSTIASYPETNTQERITFNFKHSNAFVGRPVVNFEIRTPFETSIWYKLFLPVQFPTFHPTMYNKASLAPKDQTCSLMVNHVRTFDNVTYEKPSTDCEYLLAMDCSANRRFGVTIKEGQQSREVKVAFGRQLVVVKEVGKYEAKIEVNGEVKAVKPGQSLVLAHAFKLTGARVYLQNAILTIELPKEYIKVVTDGRLVKVITSPIYLGKTCGLCGNQDQEAHKEFQGPRNCLYDVVTDFQNAYSLGKCQEVKPIAPPTCAGGEYHRRVLNVEQLLKSASKDSYKLDESAVLEKIAALEAIRSENKGNVVSPVRRTYVIKRDGRNCFSKYLVPVCRANETPLETQEAQITLVCVPRSHPLFDRWVQDAEERVIDEVSSYPYDDEMTYEVPLACLRNTEDSTRGI